MNLINEDCLTGIKAIQDNSVDLVFCDLPYGCTNIKWDEKLDLNKLATELWRVAKDETPLVFTTTMKFAMEIMKAIGEKWFRYELIWEKPRTSNHFNAGRQPLKMHEFILVFYKKQPKIYGEKIKQYHKRIAKKTTRKTNLDSTVYGNKKILKHQVHHEPRLPKTIVKFYETPTKRINKTQKPVELVEWFLKYYTNEGGLVLDPTFGSGTTAIACQNLKRDFIGFEKDEVQYKQALERLEV